PEAGAATLDVERVAGQWVSYNGAAAQQGVSPSQQVADRGHHPAGGALDRVVGGPVDRPGVEYGSVAGKIADPGDGRCRFFWRVPRRRETERGEQLTVQLSAQGVARDAGDALTEQDGVDVAVARGPTGIEQQ